MEAVQAGMFQVVIIACLVEIVHGLLLQKVVVAQVVIFPMVITV